MLLAQTKDVLAPIRYGFGSWLLRHVLSGVDERPIVGSIIHNDRIAITRRLRLPENVSPENRIADTNLRPTIACKINGVGMD